MTGTYTVTQVADNVREWSTKAGAPWKSYRVTLKHPDGREKPNVEISRVASAPKPEVGQTVEGTVEDGQYGPKLQEPRKQGGGGGFRGKTVEERRSIAMQHAQKCAVSVLEVAAQHGKYEPPGKVAELAEHVRLVATGLFAQVVDAEASGS